MDQKTKSALIAAGLLIGAGIGIAALSRPKLKGSEIPDHKFKQDQLIKGIVVEKEHTDDIKLRKDIAKGHLVEDPNAYDNQHFKSDIKKNRPAKGSAEAKAIMAEMRSKKQQRMKKDDFKKEIKEFDWVFSDE